MKVQSFCGESRAAFYGCVVEGGAVTHAKRRKPHSHLPTSGVDCRKKIFHNLLSPPRVFGIKVKKKKFTGKKIFFFLTTGKPPVGV